MGLAGRGTSGIKLEEDGEDAIERGSLIKRVTTMTTESEARSGKRSEERNSLKGKVGEATFFTLSVVR